MKTTGWGKTILSVYNYLERVTGAIDKIVEQKAVSSAYLSLSTCANSDIMAISEDLLELTERKVNLINLKLLCEKALESIKTEYAKILILTYIDKLKSYQCVSLLEMSARSYFRKLPLALVAFETALQNIGYTEARLNQIYKDEFWIMDAKDRNTLNDQIYVLDNSSFKKICRKYESNHQIRSSQIF